MKISILKRGDRFPILSSGFAVELRELETYSDLS